MAIAQLLAPKPAAADHELEQRKLALEERKIALAEKEFGLRQQQQDAQNKLMQQLLESLTRNK